MRKANSVFYKKWLLTLKPCDWVTVVSSSGNEFIDEVENVADGVIETTHCFFSQKTGRNSLKITNSKLKLKPCEAGRILMPPQVETPE